jgi:peptidyl-prolyl cis-trans isomerase SurA
MKPQGLLVLASLFLATVSASADVLDRIIVKVNGDIVTQSEFEARQIAAVQGARIGPDRIEAYLRDNNARILQDAIDDLLLIQKADEVGIRVRPEYTREIIESIKKEQNIPSDAALREQLRREGMSVDDMRRNIERSIIRRQVISREIESKVVVTDTELRAEYEQRLAEFTHPTQVRLQEILVAPSSPDAAGTAQELVRRARAGEDFSALAREYSAAASGPSGGDLGKLEVAELHSDIREAVTGLPVGGVAEPMASPDGGYRILRVSERTEQGATPFDDAKAELRKQLVDTRIRAEYDKLLKDLREKAIIDVRVREVPLQVEVPATASILDPPSPDPIPATDHAGAAARDDAEFVVSPQAAPERTSPVPEPTPEPQQEQQPRTR